MQVQRGTGVICRQKEVFLLLAGPLHVGDAGAVGVRGDNQDHAEHRVGGNVQHRAHRSGDNRNRAVPGKLVFLPD